jgi:hypothetical protein
MTNFWVFEDKPNKRVRIHRAECGTRKGAGEHPLEGRAWHGPFANYAEAFSAARRRAGYKRPNKLLVLSPSRRNVYD